MTDFSLRSNYSNSLFKTQNERLWNNKIRCHHKEYILHITALNTLLIKCDWVYGNIFKSFTKFLQEVCRFHVALTPTCCFLFYLSFTTGRCYTCLIKVLEYTLYLMFYEYKACIIHPPIAKEICFWVYLRGNNVHNGTTPSLQQQVDIKNTCGFYSWMASTIYL